MSLKSNIFFIFICAILSILFANEHSIFILFLFLIFLLFVFKKCGIKFCGILLIVFLFFNIYKINKIPVIQEGIYEQNYQIEEVKEKYLILKCEGQKYIIYHPDSLKYHVGDEVLISGEIEKISHDLNLDVFDFSDYLNHQRVFYQIKSDQIVMIHEANTLSTKIVDHLTTHLKDESYSMTKMLLFNDKYADVDLYADLKEINAVHLFVVSGFHISFFYNLLFFFFKKMKLVGSILALSICFFYIYLLNFSLSSTRAFICLFLSVFFKKQLNSLDRISISGLYFLLLEPLNVYHYSFILTFIMCIGITLTSVISKQKSKIISVLLQSFICFLLMIPIQLKLNYQINFISLISNVLLSYVVMFIFVLCIIGIIFSSFNGGIFNVFYHGFNQLIQQISSLNTSLILGSISTPLIIFYYIIVIFFLYQLEKKHPVKKWVSFLIICLFFICLYNRQYFVFYQQVIFLNVYQGDCIIIQDSFNGKVMLIDTGGLLNYDVANKNILPYLHYHGIRKIDIVLITHNDFDHNGALATLQENIKIKQIIENQNIDSFNLGKIEFKNLNPPASFQKNDNDHSIVLSANICSLNFLFTGDISKNVEKKIIENYTDLQVDVLKVAHHGSNTSTCEEFIGQIQPQYAIISVGKNNFYGHPNQEVLDTLKTYDVFIYRTDENGTTKFSGGIFQKYFIKSAK